MLNIDYNKLFPDENSLPPATKDQIFYCKKINKRLSVVDESVINNFTILEAYNFIENHIKAYKSKGYHYKKKSEFIDYDYLYDNEWEFTDPNL